LKKSNLNFEPAFPRGGEEILGIFKNTSDKTAFKKGFLQAILDNLPFNILVLNDRSQLAYVNPNFSVLTGYSKDELLEMTLTEFAQLLVVENRYDYTRYPRVLAGETIRNYTYTFKHKNGYHIKVRYSSYPLRVESDANPIGCLCIIEELEKRPQS